MVNLSGQLFEGKIIEINVKNENELRIFRKYPNRHTHQCIDHCYLL